MSRTLGIIPARYASTRFPGKPLADIQGKPMIQWVYERCSNIFEHLYVATDDYRIINAVNGFGGEAILTGDGHSSGTERCLEAYGIIRKQIDTEFHLVVNIQGDEPLVNPEQLEELISCFDDSATEIATLIQPFDETEDPENQNIVKVVVDHALKAIYFSRLPIPFKRDKSAEITHYKHIGLYAYTPTALRKICSLSPTMLEKSENLEQLRWLEHGYSIQTKVTMHKSLGVDSPADLDKVRALLLNK